MAIQRALIVDTETTGTESDSAMIEVGLILYSVTHQSTLQMFSTLLPAESNPAENVNKISMEMINECRERIGAKQIIEDMIMDADCLVAHNSAFDAQFFKPEDHLDSNVAPMTRKWPWVCTMNDFEWPIQSASQSLASVCLAHGIPVWKQHRALTDCIYIADLFDKMGEALPGMFERAMRPKAIFQAMARPFTDNDLVKSHGFRWSGDKATGWRRSMAVEDAANLPFPVRRVSE